MSAVAPTPPFRRAVPSPEFVLSPEIASAWLLSNLGNRYTSDVLALMATRGAIVPGSWPLQLADVARIAERQGRTASRQVGAFLSSVRDLMVRLDRETPDHAWNSTLVLVRTHTLNLFAAAHLELAIRLGLPLATIDRTLTRAATAAGVPIFVP